MTDLSTAPQSADDTCGCDDYGLTRRTLLKGAAAAGAAGVATSMIGDVLTQTVYGATNGNVLVVLSLRGGADGLSMVVPHAEAAYAKARPSTAVATRSLLHADPTFGLHPAFAPLSTWWAKGNLAALHAVGLPAPNRSHFYAMDALEDADAGSAARVGWLNRMISALEPRPDIMHAMQLGSTNMPTSLAGPAPSLAINDLDGFVLPLASDRSREHTVAAMLQKTYAKAGPTLSQAANGGISLTRRARAINKAVETRLPGKYAEGSTGLAMQQGARLIRAGMGVRAIAIDAGGWDHHAGLSWSVEARIKELATNLNAFFTDLGGHANRVTVVTLSEFGRRLRQNGSGGVDHGYGNCVLAMGAGVRGGKYYSRWPGLDADDLVDGDLAVTTDYRSVIGEILASRFPEVNLAPVFPGVAMQPLGFMAPRT